METVKLYGDGVHNDYWYIQAELDSGKPLVELPQPEKFYLITKTLKIHSNQELRLPQDAIIRLRGNSNCLMIKNADPENGDENIRVVGGVWDMNKAAQAMNPNLFFNPDPDTLDVYRDWEEVPTTQYVNSDKALTGHMLPDIYFGVCMAFGHVKNLYVGNLTLKDPVTYGAWAGHVEDFTFENIIFDFNHGIPYPVNMDGIHIEGWARRGVIRNLRGACYDDSVAFTDEFVKGEVSDILIDGVYGYDAHSAVRFLSSPSPIRNVTVRNVYGSYYQYAIGFTKYYNYGNGIPALFENIVVEDCEISKARKYPRYKKGSQMEQYTPFWFEQETLTRNLTIRNVRRVEWNCPCELIRIEEGATVENLTLENITQKGMFMPEPPLLVNKGTLKK